MLGATAVRHPITDRPAFFARLESRIDQALRSVVHCNLLTPKLACTSRLETWLRASGFGFSAYHSQTKPTASLRSVCIRLSMSMYPSKLSCARFRYLDDIEWRMCPCTVQSTCKRSSHYPVSCHPLGCISNCGTIQPRDLRMHSCADVPSIENSSTMVYSPPSHQLSYDLRCRVSRLSLCESWHWRLRAPTSSWLPGMCSVTFRHQTTQRVSATARVQNTS